MHILSIAKHRGLATVIAAILVAATLSGCVVRPAGYWGPEHPRYYYDRW